MAFPGEKVNGYVVIFVGDNKLAFPWLDAVWRPNAAELRKVMEFCASDERRELRAVLEAEIVTDGTDDGVQIDTKTGLTRAVLLDEMLYELATDNSYDDWVEGDPEGDEMTLDSAWKQQKAWLNGSTERAGKRFNPGVFHIKVMIFLLNTTILC